MPQPYDYSIKVPDPTQSVLSGVQTGFALHERGAKIEEQKRIAEQQLKMQEDLAAIANNPTPSALASAMVKYPQLSEHFKRGYDVLSTEQQKSQLGQATQVYAAMQSGKTDVAQQLLMEQATAARNSGLEQDAKAAETISELVKLHPETASMSTGIFLASVMGPDKFAETFTKLQAERRDAELHPSEMTEHQAKAQKAATDAKFAESTAVLEIQKRGWDIRKIQEDIKIAKANTNIAAANAAVAREGNTLKRQEIGLKVEEMMRARDEKIRDKIADVDTARSNMDNMLNTADRILQTPFSVIDDATGPIRSRIVTTDAKVADFEGLVENLTSQAFMAQVPNLKGMGALSNSEGEKLQSALQNLKLRQSPERLLDNVKEAQRLVMKARKNLSLRHGVPDNVPDTPSAAPSPDEIESLILKHGGRPGHGGR